MAVLRQTTFTLNEAEQENAKEWMDKHETDNFGECICRGHRWSIIFTPEHLVPCAKVRCNGCRAEFDITDEARVDSI